MAFTFEEFPNSDFYNSDLREVLRYIRLMIPAIDSLEHWRAQHEVEYTELKALYDEVKDDWDRFAAGDFPESTYAAMKEWWENNAVDLVGELVRFVFFGLTDDGYFVAYIPENWRNIQFDTIVTPGEDYGRLCIYY